MQIHKNTLVLALVLSIVYNPIIEDGLDQINAKSGHFFIAVSHAIHSSFYHSNLSIQISSFKSLKLFLSRVHFYCKFERHIFKNPMCQTKHKIRQ